MSNLLLRMLTALLLIPLLIAAIEWKNPLGVWLWVLAAQLFGLREWMIMTLPGGEARSAPPSEGGRRPPPDRDRRGATRWFGVLLGAACVQGLYWVPGEPAHLLILCGTTIAAFLYFLFTFTDIAAVAQRVSLLLCGVFYAGVLILPLALFKHRPQGDGAAWVYVCLTVSWLSDTGAYFAGRFLGPFWPAKLFPSVSPKKTVVGAIGGLLGSTGAVLVAKLWYLQALSYADVALLAVPANLLGQAGDLCESLIKRSVGVKDSGTLLPGHGGMLDRIDALLFVVPYVYAYATFFIR